jgi:DNA gyrase subunit A
VVAIKPVVPGDELMLITRQGIINRQSIDGIRVIGRNTQGVRLVNLSATDVVVDVACVVSEEEIAEIAEQAGGAVAEAELETVGGDGETVE